MVRWRWYAGRRRSNCSTSSSAIVFTMRVASAERQKKEAEAPLEKCACSPPVCSSAGSSTDTMCAVDRPAALRSATKVRSANVTSDSVSEMPEVGMIMVVGSSLSPPSPSPATTVGASPPPLPPPPPPPARRIHPDPPLVVAAPTPAPPVVAAPTPAPPVSPSAPSAPATPALLAARPERARRERRKKVRAEFCATCDSSSSEVTERGPRAFMRRLLATAWMYSRTSKPTSTGKLERPALSSASASGTSGRGSSAGNGAGAGALPAISNATVDGRCRFRPAPAAGAPSASRLASRACMHAV